jgi:hypothetical protein
MSTFRTRHTPGCYLVTDGATTFRYTYELGDFDSKRAAHQLAIAEEELRNELVAAAEERAAVRAELEAAAEREAVAAILDELQGEQPHVAAYGRAIEALADGAEWWCEGRRLVVQRVRGSRHVITAEGCECIAGQYGRLCWASALAQALGRLERRERRAA